MKRFAILLMLLSPAVLLADDYYQPIPMSEVARFMNQPDVVVLDVNVEEVWMQVHIPGAVHVTSPDIAKYLPQDRKSLLIFYCAGPLCNASGSAANRAVILGFRRVYVMRDGIFAWKKAGYPVESGYRAGKNGAGGGRDFPTPMGSPMKKAGK